MKKCHKCGTVNGVDFSEYSWRKYKWCMACCRAYRREYYRENKDAVYAANRRWRAKHPGYYNEYNRLHMREVMANYKETHGIEYKERMRRWQQANYDRFYEIKRKYRRANMEKYWAQVCACKEFPSREPCSIVSCTNIGERHHPDYSEPYKIVWLCRKHHKELHNLIPVS